GRRSRPERVGGDYRHRRQRDRLRRLDGQQDAGPRDPGRAGGPALTKRPWTRRSLMAKTLRCLGLAIALAAQLSVEAALGQTFQGTFDKHQLIWPLGSQADRSTATATLPFSDTSLSHGTFVGSIQMTASPETLPGEIDATGQKMAAPIHIGMTINFASTLPQRARDQNTFQKFRTTVSLQMDDAFTNCTAAPQVQSGLEFGPHSYSASLTCDFSTPSFSVSLSQNGVPLTGYSLFRTLVQFLIEPESGGFSNYRAEVWTYFQWD